MSDATQLRIIIAILGALLLLGMYLFGQPKQPKQGTRTAKKPAAAGGERVEPTLGDTANLDGDGIEPGLAAELDRLGSAIKAQRGGDALAEPAPPVKRSPVGTRPEAKVDRIVTLHVCARPGETIGGPELVVAAEKAGLEFGDMDIFHRLVEGRPELGPVFSAANMVKPGRFDMATIGTLRTPGISLFMTLPGPLPALDAWDTMLPAAQRLAELLDAQVLDEERNALGRQTIQHVREELRAYDRKQEKNVIKKSW
jgi:cell division protein ZipA